MKDYLPPTHIEPSSRWRDVASRTRTKVSGLIWLVRNAHYQQKQATYTLRDERAAEELREAKDGGMRPPPA
jgi:hypothetical protein